MQAEDVAEILEPSRIEQDPDGSVWMPALLSLLLPGAGQFWLGQWGRGLRLFGGSATFCFGLGIANVLVAYDAYSLALDRREGSISTRKSSTTLGVFTFLWSGFVRMIDGMAASMSRGPGPAVFVALPLMFVSWLAGGRGFSLRR